MAEERVQDDVRTEIHFLRALTAERAMALYDRVIGRGSVTHLAPGRAAGSLVVRDHAPRLDRFRRLLVALDQPREGELRIFARVVVHRSAESLAALLQQTWTAAGRGPLAMVGDDRARLLLVRSTLETYRSLDRMVRRLDQPEQHEALP